MNSQNKESTATDAEYQYGDDLEKGSSYVEQAESQPRPGLRERISRFLPKNKKMTVFIVIVAVAFIAFKMFGPGNQVAVRPPAEQAVNQELDKSGVAKPTQALENLNPAPVAPKQLLVEEPVAVNNTEIKALEGNIQEMSQSLKGLQSAITVLANSVIQVSDRVQILEEAEAARNKAMKPGSAPAYDLQSLVAGRAWLHSKHAPFISVKVGDELAGYGKIEEIDAEGGAVLTSSGKVITYGPLDN